VREGFGRERGRLRGNDWPSRAWRFQGKGTERNHRQTTQRHGHVRFEMIRNEGKGDAIVIQDCTLVHNSRWWAQRNGRAVGRSGVGKHQKRHDQSKRASHSPDREEGRSSAARASQTKRGAGRNEVRQAKQETHRAGHRCRRKKRCHYRRPGTAPKTKKKCRDCVSRKNAPGQRGKLKT